MSTGPESYTAGLRLLAEQRPERGYGEDDVAYAARCAVQIAEAQAHLTAALVNVIGLATTGIPQDGETAGEWRRVLLGRPKPPTPTYEQVFQAWHGTDGPWGGCADSANVERVMRLITGREGTT